MLSQQKHEYTSCYWGEHCQPTDWCNHRGEELGKHSYRVTTEITMYSNETMFHQDHTGGFWGLTTVLTQHDTAVISKHHDNTTGWWDAIKVFTQHDTATLSTTVWQDGAEFAPWSHRRVMRPSSVNSAWDYSGESAPQSHRVMRYSNTV